MKAVSGPSVQETAIVALTSIAAVLIDGGDGCRCWDEAGQAGHGEGGGNKRRGEGDFHRWGRGDLDRRGGGCLSWGWWRGLGRGRRGGLGLGRGRRGGGPVAASLGDDDGLRAVIPERGRHRGRQGTDFRCQPRLTHETLMKEPDPEKTIQSPMAQQVGCSMCTCMPLYSPVAASWAVTQDLVRGDGNVVALEVVLIKQEDLVSGCLEGDPADLVGAARDPGIQGGRVITTNTQGDGPACGQCEKAQGRPGDNACRADGAPGCQGLGSRRTRRGFRQSMHQGGLGFRQTAHHFASGVKSRTKLVGAGWGGVTGLQYLNRRILSEWGNPKTP